MSGNKTWRNALTIFVILVGTALLTAVWPLLINPASNGVERIPPEVPIVEIEAPVLSLPVIGDVGGPIELNGFAAVGILAVLIIGAVVVTGGILAVLYVLLARQTVTVKDSEAFKAKQAALEKREQGKIRQLREGRKAAPVPTHKMPRWSSISTSLIILLFIAFFGLVLNEVFVPGGEIVWLPPWSNTELVISSVWLFVGVPILVTLPILAWRLRPQRLEEVEATDNRGIPWDFIAVLLTGLLVVGLGIGIMVYLNVPV